MSRQTRTSEENKAILKTLKFRIYDKTEKKMKLLDSIWNMPDPSYDFDEIQQFTGLLDRHGKEIYEGDIVATPTWPFDPSNGDAQVTLLPITFEYGMFKIGDDYICDHDLQSETEIIGNIYEHPHLLENK